MKLSKSFSGALRTFAYFLASGNHYQLNGVEYLDLFGKEPSAIEKAFAIYANVIELDENGKVVNAKYAEKRAVDYIRSYCISDFNVNPPYEDWETELYSPPPLKDERLNSKGDQKINLLPLKKVDDNREFWKGTRFRLYNVGLNVEKADDDFYEYMLAEVPGERKYMLLTCVEGYKSGSAFAYVKTLESVSRFVVTGKALKYSMGTENTYLKKE